VVAFGAALCRALLVERLDERPKHPRQLLDRPSAFTIPVLLRVVGIKTKRNLSLTVATDSTCVGSVACRRERGRRERADRRVPRRQRRIHVRRRQSRGVALGRRPSGSEPSRLPSVIVRRCRRRDSLPSVCSRVFRMSQAEGEGFEPSSDPEARNGFRDRRIRPLCHPSDGSTGYLGLLAGRLRSRSAARRAAAREARRRRRDSNPRWRLVPP
jgi:hypothetical protein